MTFRGHIHNGVAVLDTPTALPEGTPVRIEVDSEFWTDKTIEQLSREQNVNASERLEDLSAAWPAEDGVDDFLKLVREVRA